MAKKLQLFSKEVWDAAVPEYGFNRPASLCGIITKIEFFDANTGSGRYCKIYVDNKGMFILNALKAISSGLPESAKPNEYFLEPGNTLRIRKI
ncbi:MAG: hypothetical protein KUL83_01385 [Lentimicrobium sp.]|jgi:hypothetical protein|nr:hypothetical protein [Lentimicrobium sp.]MDY0024965.1 hypothetical protein [Lentimicrobium sp.]HAH59842.1 hypothetical protein [Bacteroidales bacterium]